MARFQTRRGPPPPNDAKHGNSIPHSRKENRYESIEPSQEPTPPAEEETEEIEEEDNEEFDEEGGQCVHPKYYGRFIEVYHCLWKPEQLAFNICLWDQRKCIDICIDVSPDAPNIPDNSIPGDAIYIVVGDTIMSNPYGHTALFCRKMTDPKTGYERYKAAVGFYWSFERERGNQVYSLSEYFHEASESHIVDLYERVRPEDPNRFREVYGLLTQVVSREMAALASGERDMVNLMGHNRMRPTRWRSVVKQKQKS